ncbi:MAG: Hpt domain-containing protein [Gammaproteobacteria bacterium]|nr:Hpt domain-containing protein [Gammaproteobacteria bacterium]
MHAQARQDRSALRWIRGELDQSLREARTQLEEFAEGHEGARLEGCAERLHQVHGALEMVQVYGGAMLADEMEQLARALAAGTVKRPDGASEALMLGMVQLPAYLEKVESGGADIPLVLLPLMNDLRAARDAALVSETSLFAPKLNAVIAAETVRPGSGNRDMPRLIHQHRSQYHRGLLSWIRDHQVRESIVLIRDVLDALNSAAGTARMRRLLDAAEALTIALLDDDSAPALAVKPLFGKLDREFKRVIDQGEEAAMLDFPVELLKNLLYYIVRSKSTDPAVLAVQQAAEVVNSFPDQADAGAQIGALGAPDRALFSAVGDALAQDLRDVKDQLDLYIRGDRSQIDRLTNLAQPIRRIGDTLGMVGRGDLRTRLKHRCDELDAAKTAGSLLDDERLMTLAGELLLVESSLASLASGDSELMTGHSADDSPSQLLSEGEMRQHQRAAVDEAMVELARSKDEILEYLAQPSEHQKIAAVPPRLHMVAGVMSMLGLPEAGRLLHDLKPYIGELAAGERGTPDVAGRDALADVMMSAELYLQSIVEPGADRAQLLAFAEDGLRRLGLRDSAPAEAEVDVAEAASEAAPVEVAVEPEPDITSGLTFDAEEQDIAGPAAGDEVMLTEPEPEPEPEPETQIMQDTSAASEAIEAAAEPEMTQEPAESVPHDAATAQAEEVEIDDDVDSEILEIFAEEAAEELSVIQDCLPRWCGNPDDQESLHTMRRSFHTLKGSGRIVGAMNLGDFAWSIENLLNRVIDGTVTVTPALLGLLDDANGVLPTLISESTTGARTGSDVSALAARAFALADPSQRDSEAMDTTDRAPEAAPEARGEVPPSDELPLEIERVPEITQVEPPVAPVEMEPLSLEGLREPGDESLLLDSVMARSGPASARGHTPLPTDESILTGDEVQDSEFSDLDGASQAMDTSLSAVFINEVHGHLNVLDGYVQRCADTPGGCVMEAGVRRAMHTLRGSARTAGVDPMAELAGSLENYAEALQNSQQPTDGRALDLLNRCHRSLSQLALAVEDAQPLPADWEALQSEVQRETEGLAEQQKAQSEQSAEGPDPELLEIFLDEAKELLESLETELSAWESADDDGAVARLQRNLHTMKGGARLAGVDSLGNLSHALESAFESVVERRIASEPRLKQLVRHATDTVAQDIEYLIRGEMPGAHPHMVDRLEAAARGQHWDDIAADEAAIDDESQFGSTSLMMDEFTAADIGSGQPESSADDAALPVDADSELAAPAAAALADDDLGEILQSPAEDDLEIVGDAGDDMDDDSAMLADSTATAEQGDSADSVLLTDSQLLTDSELLEEPDYLDSDQMMPAAVEPETVVQLATAGMAAGEEDGFVPRKPLPEQPATAAVGSERVRVTSEALDQMVNNAGEVSIYRARIEQQNNSFAFNLGELRQTIDRLRSQLRGLENETEAQILSRHERDTESRADFDPLELDRYSTIQQLSRALSETVEDLSNLGQSLNDLSRDTDTLLLQQARVTTDLQDGLLRTRMVRFASRVPRLERVVRQTGHSIGKHAALKVIGGDEDMDRAILERMMGPLEHLLRNAVSHGIESEEVRVANGKPAQGLITLELAREGTDVVLTLSDDGGGLDRDRIRSKAIERGLLAADAAVGDGELFQMILQPGFSTAQELSQVSGRGVGMDVVLTEVKQLGGALEIDSTPGKGTRFVIRLPFTLAITDALLVHVGDDFYAVPHSSMDGVARVGTDELRALYAGKQDAFSYGGRDYAVRYLGDMLAGQAPQIPEGARWLPLLLVRSGENRVAIHVDGLLGNRQIVVKSIGVQLSGVRWFSGGTILADGQIALILDINSLVRMDIAHPSTQQRQETAAPLTKGVSVMVVDDSITVRKVTSRLLERHNMQVTTAKDGVDAVTLLQEVRPDVMLLDIEMPRMDGFELARHMHSTPELQAIPIIMITSRTGDKHRNRALELGVKRYLGKPYQEADLLENIYTVLAETSL